jgi:hypothetical protein
MVREDQRPHPWASYGRGVGFEDAADDCPIRRHVKIVGIPLPGRARSRGTFEDEAHPAHLRSLKDQQPPARWSWSKSNCLVAAASARSRSGASTEPRYWPLLRMMVTAQLRSLAAGFGRAVSLQRPIDGNLPSLIVARLTCLVVTSIVQL